MKWPLQLGGSDTQVVNVVKTVLNMILYLTHISKNIYDWTFKKGKFVKNAGILLNVEKRTQENHLAIIYPGEGGRVFSFSKLKHFIKKHFIVCYNLLPDM